MLKIRLQRRGKKNFATFRVIVAEQSAPVKGKFIEDLGFYNPHTNEFKVVADKVTAWLARGAQASGTVHNLLVTHKIIDAAKVTIWKPPVKTAAATEATAPAKEAAPKEPVVAA